MLSQIQERITWFTMTTDMIKSPVLLIYTLQDDNKSYCIIWK